MRRRIDALRCSPECQEAYNQRARAERFEANPLYGARTIDCALCGEPMKDGGTQTVGQSAHLACRQAVLRTQHGTIHRYLDGCGCNACWQAYRRYGRGVAVSDDVRQRVYVRDNWVCQLCFEPVDPDIPSNDRMGATLDHIVCQSLTLFPDDSEQNLRLAHRSCNSKRGNLGVLPGELRRD
ncbi:HNH endonuclease [Nocardia abscessus]|uniref:HNH endonuclease n=1 Tax=Nocardia abscessus TaxID=120957 RepID=UPI002456CA9B|nr:HNH endonuclease [Nocardia abscessus]